jgi:hypothetical protein
MRKKMGIEPKKMPATVRRDGRPVNGENGM